MEYTKDVIFNVRHTNGIGVLKLKRRRVLTKLFRIVSENKFITIILLSMITLIAVDIALVNTFMNILITL